MTNRPYESPVALECDMCKASGYAPPRLAVWDAPIHGLGWGYVCTEHGRNYGVSRNPVAKKITYPDDVKAAFRRAYARAAAKRR